MRKTQLVELSLAGAAVYWATSLAIALLPFSAQFRATESYSFTDVLLGAFPAGFLIALVVGYGLFRYSEKVPSKVAVFVSVSLSVAALVAIEVAATLLHGGNEVYYFSIGTLLSIPRFLALGVTLGYLYPKLDSAAPALGPRS